MLVSLKHPQACEALIEPESRAHREAVVLAEVVLSAREACGSPVFDDADLRARAELTARDAKRMDRFSLLAIAAVRELIRDVAPGHRASCGFVGGNMTAGWTITEPQLRELHAHGPCTTSPYLASAWFPAAAQGQVSIHTGVRGYAKTLATDRCAGVQAIAHAAQCITSGRADLMIAGGVEAPVTSFVETALRQSGAAIEHLSEAAAFVLLGVHERGGSVRGSIDGSVDEAEDCGDSVFIRTQLSLSLANTTTAAASRRIAAALQRDSLTHPCIVVCACAPCDAQFALATSMVQQFLLGRRPPIVFPARTSGETLAADSAIAVATACRQLRGRPLGEAALVLTLGTFAIDVLCLQRWM